MHQGQLPAPPSHNGVPQYAPGQPPAGTVTHSSPQIPVPSQLVAATEAQDASSLDDLIANASKQADATNAAAAAAATKTEVPTPTAPAKEDPAEEKVGTKKDKEKEKAKATRLVYSDNETSPEEKMAMLPKYAFTPTQRTIVV